jgi:hypothetical protein
VHKRLQAAKKQGVKLEKQCVKLGTQEEAHECEKSDKLFKKCAKRMYAAFRYTMFTNISLPKKVAMV